MEASTTNHEQIQNHNGFQRPLLTPRDFAKCLRKRKLRQRSCCYLSSLPSPPPPSSPTRQATTCAATEFHDKDNNHNTAHLTIVDFIQATGESVHHLGKKTVEKYTDRRLLALSAEWSKTVAAQRRSLGDEQDLYHISAEVDKWAASLTPMCARLEVDAVSLLSSFEEEKEEQTSHNDMDKSHRSWDDDGLSREVERLSSAVQLLQDALLDWTEEQQQQPQEELDHKNERDAARFVLQACSRATEMTDNKTSSTRALLGRALSTRSLKPLERRTSSGRDLTALQRH